MRVNYVIVFVSDMQRSVAFYRDVLELPLKFETPQWTEFATAGATLALHISDAAAVDPANGGDLVAGRSRPGFSVPDLDAFHQRMIARQVTCAEQPKEVFGARIAQYLDPDGLTISVSQERAAG
jgi:lactoylglutathione lyase